MSKSLSVYILLPMDHYDEQDVYEEDTELKQLYGNVPKVDGFIKTLKTRSMYSSGSDIKEYLIKKYGIEEELFKNYGISYNGRDSTYRFEDGTSVILTKEEEEKLKREHIDENVYCLPYKYLSADIYGTVIDELLKDTFTIVNDELINRAIELVGCRYSSKCDLEEVDSVFDYIEDEAMDIMMDYESDMDGKLLVSLIIGKYIATRVNGIAVAEYD